LILDAHLQPQVPSRLLSVSVRRAAASGSPTRLLRERDALLLPPADTSEE